MLPVSRAERLGSGLVPESAGTHVMLTTAGATRTV